jgi:hypothetical protein
VNISRTQQEACVQRFSNSKMIGDCWSILKSGETSHAAARTNPAPILVDAPTAAATLWVSERAFHSLRKRSDFPQNATVVLGPRCVRFRLEALHAFALSIAAAPRCEPRRPPGRGAIHPQKEHRDCPKVQRAAPTGSGTGDLPDESPGSDLD